MKCPHYTNDEVCAVCRRFEEFAKMVSEMRQAQSDYFSSRDLEALKRAKVLESRVDRELIRLEIANCAEWIWENTVRTEGESDVEC